MLNDADLDALLAGRHADPFSRLGLHADEAGRLWVRALLPGAAAVALVDAASGKRLVELAERRGGFFEALVPRRKHRFDYRLAVRWAGGEGAEGVYADPYAFYPQLADEELAAFAEGRHFRPWLSLGAHLVTHGEVSGVRFATWAPNARRVSVVGSFNNWDGRRHPMRLRHQAGVWEIFVPHAAEGDLYKFEIVSGNGVGAGSASVPTGASRPSASTRCMPPRGAAAWRATSRPGTSWPRSCPPTRPTWASPMCS